MARMFVDGFELSSLHEIQEFIPSNFKQLPASYDLDLLPVGWSIITGRPKNGPTKGNALDQWYLCLRIEINDGTDCEVVWPLLGEIHFRSRGGGQTWRPWELINTTVE